MRIERLFLSSLACILILLSGIYFLVEETLTIEGDVLSVKQMDNSSIIYLKTDDGVEKVFIKPNMSDTIEGISIGDTIAVKGDIVYFKGNKGISGEEIFKIPSS